MTFVISFYTRSSSVVCNDQSSHVGPETNPSLPGLACPGWRDRPGLVVPSSPFPLLTSLALLLETITGIHKGLSSKVGLPEEFKYFKGVFYIMRGQRRKETSMWFLLQSLGSLVRSPSLPSLWDPISILLPSFSDIYKIPCILFKVFPFRGLTFSLSLFLVCWSPLVRICGRLPTRLQSGYAHPVSHQSLASPTRTPPPLPVAPAGTQTGRLQLQSNQHWLCFQCLLKTDHILLLYF